jgi:hypothetical protein
MTRLGSLIYLATFGTGLLACGSSNSPKAPLDLVPQDNDVSGWMVDQENTKTPGTRAMTASTQRQAENLIDGGATPFYTPPFTPVEFLWQNYVNSTLAAAPTGAWVMLYILVMPSSEQASGLYASLLQQSEYSRKAGTSEDWQPTSPPLGAGSRIQDTASSWWINFHQGVYYVEVKLGPSFGPPPDYPPSDPDLKQECFRFAQAVALGI